MKSDSKYDICCIGHITLDKVVTPEQTVFMAGGTAYYFANALAQIDHSGFILATSVADTELKVVEEIREKGIEVDVYPSRRTVFFENIYGSNSNIRIQHVLDKADPFSYTNLKHIDSKIYHLGTLLADDFPGNVIVELSRKGKVSVDAQGFLRDVRGTEVFPCDWENKLALLPYIHILKANEHEMLSLTGTDDPLQAAHLLAEWGVEEVVLTLGDQGSAIYSEGKLHWIPAYPVEKVVDATGCGDTYMAGYLLRRAKGFSIEESGRFAAAMCSLKLGRSGPFAGTEEEISKLLNMGKKRCSG